MNDWGKLNAGPPPSTHPHADEPLPVEALRDLLGVARALYGARRAQGTSKAELKRLWVAGNQLKAAIDLAGRSTVGSPLYLSAWYWAEEGTRGVTGSVDALMAAEPLLEAAVERVRRSGGS